QRRNTERFTSDAVRKRVVDALRKVLPAAKRFTTVSIIICTYNRADLLERCLDYLQYQTNQNFEVVGVNGPSNDGTDAVLERYKDRIKIGSNPQRNLAISRNIGIDLADGDLLAFIDDDALPFDDWVETLLEEFNRRPLTLGALGGPAYYAGTLRYQSEDIGINKFAEAKGNIESREIGENGW
ncbi:glycosyltransferase family 2 protein, partial [Burkholderia gladioli]|uniref:glycosyltransferase family 2 protein n=1 Tax=Burkholderia gladioli TaxID=28095 RepID=UPI001FC8E178